MNGSITQSLQTTPNFGYFEYLVWKWQFFEYRFPTSAPRQTVRCWWAEVTIKSAAYKPYCHAAFLFEQNQTQNRRRRKHGPLPSGPLKKTILHWKQLGWLMNVFHVLLDMWYTSDAICINKCTTNRIHLHSITHHIRSIWTDIHWRTLRHQKSSTFYAKEFSLLHGNGTSAQRAIGIKCNFLLFVSASANELAEVPAGRTNVSSWNLRRWLSWVFHLLFWHHSVLLHNRYYSSRVSSSSKSES